MIGGRSFTALLLLTFAGHAQPLPMEERSVLRFGDMVGCLNEEKLGTTMIKYTGYGCYCGFGGKGEPVDEIDRCCQIHDDCYGTAVTSGECHKLQVYIALYQYRCDRYTGEISCDPADKYSWYHSLDPKCAALVCECDKEAAICIAREKFREEYKNYDKEKC